jgi:hypothetical protein
MRIQEGLGGYGRVHDISGSYQTLQDPAGHPRPFSEKRLTRTLLDEHWPSKTLLYTPGPFRTLPDIPGPSWILMDSPGYSPWPSVTFQELFQQKTLPDPPRHFRTLLGPPDPLRPFLTPFNLQNPPYILFRTLLDPSGRFWILLDSPGPSWTLQTPQTTAGTFHHLRKLRTLGLKSNHTFLNEEAKKGKDPPSRRVLKILENW